MMCKWFAGGRVWSASWRISSERKFLANFSQGLISLLTFFIKEESKARPARPNARKINCRRGQMLENQLKYNTITTAGKK
jgi:hypothetical protein